MKFKNLYSIFVIVCIAIHSAALYIASLKTHKEGTTHTHITSF